MKELTQETLSTEIFSLCLQEPQSIETITNAIYKNMYAKNLVRIYLCVQIMLKREILVPMFSNKEILFKVHDKILNKVKK